MKRRPTKRILAMILSVCMILTMMPSMVFAGPIGNPVEPVVEPLEDAEASIQSMDAPAPVAETPKEVDSLDTLNQAIASGETSIKLKNNIEISEIPGNYMLVKIDGTTAAKPVTIDLNGNSIVNNTIVMMFTISNGADVILTNTKDTGELKNTGTSAIATTVINVNASQLTLDGGIKITGGAGTSEIKSTNVNGQNAAISANKGSEINVKNAFISGGEIPIEGAAKGNAPAIKKGVGECTLTITGGNFKGTVGSKTSWAEQSSITGGKFFPKPDSLLVASGYEATGSDGEGWTVAKSEKEDFEVEVTTEQETRKGDLKDLFSLYSVEGTFKLLKDVKLELEENYGNDIPGVFEAQYDLKFDTNGKTLTVTGTKARTLKITDVSTSGDGKISHGGLNPDTENNYEKKVSDDGKIITIDKVAEKKVVEATLKTGNPKQPDETETMQLDQATFESYLSNVNYASRFVTIKLLDSITTKNYITVSRNGLTLDLNGKTLTYNGSDDYAAVISQSGSFDEAGDIIGGKLIVKSSGGNEGKLAVSGNKARLAIALGSTGMITTPSGLTRSGSAIIEKNVTVEGGIGVFNNSALDVFGTVTAKGDFAISGNGAEGHGGSTIVIHNGAKIESAVKSGGDATAAIYHPQDGTLIIGCKDATIECTGDCGSAGGPTVTGAAGIVMRGGELKVNDGTIEATGTSNLSIGDSGTTVPPAGIVADRNESYNNGDLNVSVSGENTRVEAAKSQHSVTYTENGIENDTTKEPPITVGAGVTLECGSDPDTNANKYVDPGLEVDESTGEVVEDKNVRDVAVESVLPYDNSGLFTTEQLVDAKTYNAFFEKDSAKIIFVANNLKPHKADDSGKTVAYWVGLTIAAPDGYTKADVSIGKEDNVQDKDIEGGKLTLYIGYKDVAEFEKLSTMTITWKGGSVENTTERFSVDFDVNAFEPENTLTPGFKANKDLANKGANINDAGENTFYVTFKNALDEPGYWLVFSQERNENKVVMAALENSDFVKNTKPRKGYAWNISNKTQVSAASNIDLKPGIYKAELYFIPGVVPSEVSNWKTFPVDESEAKYKYKVKVDEATFEIVEYTVDLNGGSYATDIDFTDTGVRGEGTEGNPWKLYAMKGDTDLGLPTPIAPSGKHFSRWGVSADGKKIVAQYADNYTGGGGGTTTPTTPPTVEVPTPSNGAVSVDKPDAIAGETVKITPKANEGYVVDQVVVTDKNGGAVAVKDNGDGTYSFTMPAADLLPVTVNVTFKKDEGGEVTPPPIEEGTLVFASAAQKRDIANRLTTSKDTSLKLKADAEGVTIGNLADWDVTSDNPDVVEVLRPSHKLHYVGVGTANITVKATGSDGKVYSIVIPISVKLGTPTFTLSHVSSKKTRTFTVTTSTVRGADGFQVKYSLKKSLKSSKTKTYECGKKLNRQTVKAKKSKRTYYVRVRAYIIDEDGNITTGAWSKLTKKIKSK